VVHARAEMAVESRNGPNSYRYVSNNLKFVKLIPAKEGRSNPETCDIKKKHLKIEFLEMPLIRNIKFV
jgi:hypothetical protein